MPPEDPREKRGRDGLWKVPPPWEPAAKPARSHRGLEAFGFHTFHSPDGGLTYKPLTQGVGPFYSIGVGSFYVVKATQEATKLEDLLSIAEWRLTEDERLRSMARRALSFPS